MTKTSFVLAFAFVVAAGGAAAPEAGPEAKRPPKARTAPKAEASPRVEAVPQATAPLQAEAAAKAEEAAEPKVTAGPEATLNVFESATPPKPASQLDRIVLGKLSSLDLQPVLCSDAVFVRRAYLDVIGTLPTAQEAREFILDPDLKNKRRALIDRLLERDEFADYWSMRWGDILRIKAEFPVNLWPNAAQAYHRWVRASLVANKPYDTFVRELLTSSGSNFRVGPVNFYRAVQNRTPEGIAGAVALTFMGSRIDSWPSDRATGMTAFFSQIGYKPTNEWKEENVFWDPLKASTEPGSIAPEMPSACRDRPPVLLRRSPRRRLRRTPRRRPPRARRKRRSSQMEPKSSCPRTRIRARSSPPG